MKHKIFTVFDVKAQAYLPPFFLPTEGMAIRAFTDCANDIQHQFGRHPQDYTMFCIGTYDDSSAHMELSAPQAVRNGLEVLRPSREAQPELPLQVVDGGKK